MGRWNPCLAAAALLVVVAGCAPDGSPIAVERARIGQPAGSTAALYLTATSNGDADRLIGARTDVAAAVELHESVIGDDGTATMRPVPAMDLPADGALVLEPGGLHLMLVDVEPLEVGTKVEVVLQWEQAGDATVEAEVVEPGETMDDGHG